jgi:hypothetical protein
VGGLRYSGREADAVDGGVRVADRPQGIFERGLTTTIKVSLIRRMARRYSPGCLLIRSTEYSMLSNAAAPLSLNGTFRTANGEAQSSR